MSTDKLVFALDVPTCREACEWVQKLHEHVGFFKVGLELFSDAFGSSDAKVLLELIGDKLIFDVKFHDIPQTVERALTRLSKHRPRYVTVHSQQKETLESVARVAQQEGLTPLVVTLLTSLAEQDLTDLDSDQYFSLRERVLMRAKLAERCGINGLVCSPEEVKFLKDNLENPFLMVPGIRMTSSHDDQKRIGSPRQTIQDGADLIVVGRPIRDAANPVQAAKDIIASIV